MINSPACWKQCCSVLATCGMPPYSVLCISAYECETACISIALRLQVGLCKGGLCVCVALCCAQAGCWVAMNYTIQL